MRAVRIFLQARAVIQFILRAGSTLENTNSSEQFINLVPAGISILFNVNVFFWANYNLTSISSLGFDDRQTGFPLIDEKRFNAIK